MKKFLNEFKEFAMRGNVLDMAVGVVIGSSFTAIVTSIVNDIFTPVIAALTSKVSFQDIKIVLKQTEDGIISINIGAFIQTVINFIIVAFVIFIVIKAINEFNAKFSKKKEEAPAEPVKSAELLELEKIAKLLEDKK